MKGCGSFLGPKWMWQSVTKNWAGLINSAAVSERQPDWHIKAWKTQGTADISNKKSTISIPPTSSLNLPLTQHWPFGLNGVTLNGGGKLWKKVSICVLLATQTDRRDHLSVDSLKEKRKAGGVKKRAKSSLPDVFFSLFFHEVLSVPAIPLSAFH